MLYRTVYQKVVVSPANMEHSADLVLALLRNGWKITNVIEVPTKKVVVFVHQKVWCRPIRFFIKAARLVSGRKKSYSVKRG